MPTIAYFYGIAIRMFFADHPPPHFFAAYSGHEGNVSIATGEVIEGHLPANAAQLVRQWTLAHQDELEDNWRSASFSRASFLKTARRPGPMATMWRPAGCGAKLRPAGRSCATSLPESLACL